MDGLHTPHVIAAWSDQRSGLCAPDGDPSAAELVRYAVRNKFVEA